MISSNSTSIVLPIIHVSNFYIARFNILVYSVRSVFFIYIFIYLFILRSWGYQFNYRQMLPPLKKFLLNSKSILLTQTLHSTREMQASLDSDRLELVQQFSFLYYLKQRMSSLNKRFLVLFSVQDKSKMKKLALVNGNRHEITEHQLPLKKRLSLTQGCKELSMNT